MGIIKWFIMDWKGFSEEIMPEWNIKQGSKFTIIKGCKVRLSLLIRKKNKTLVGQCSS